MMNLTYPQSRIDRTWISAVACLMTLASLTGCGSMSLLSRRNAMDDRITNDPNHSIAGIQGPTERSLRRARWNDEKQNLANGAESGLADAYQEYLRAESLYENGQLAEAEVAFRELAKSRRDTFESLGAKWNRWWGITPAAAYDPYSNFGDPVEEDALFMAAECQVALKRYAKAQDSYGSLLERYPSTRHLDQVTGQLFRIARYWLDAPEAPGDEAEGRIQLAGGETVEEQSNTPSALSRVPVLPNLTDPTRPTFDTYGRGLQALRSIWLHDATGPLADDALMLAAGHHLRTDNFVEAARMYELLREQYPDSPHLKDAFLLGSHVTLASYQGPAYDSQPLQKSRELKEMMLQAFPDLTPEQRQRLQSEVRRLEDEEVARIWDLVEFYQIKGVPESVALHCHLIINRYPDSRFAEMARQALREQEQNPKASRRWSLWPQRRSEPVAFPEAPNPRRQTARVSPPPGSDVSLPTDRQSPDGTMPAEPPSMFDRMGSFLRRSEQPPELQPIDDPNDSYNPPSR